MSNYILGVFLAVLGGVTAFTGQILQKLAINQTKKEKSVFSVKDLVKKPVWIIGILLVCVVNVIIIAVAQSLIGPALIPGLTASGFIFLGIGSVKILKEEIKKEEIMATAMLVAGIVLITLSRLSIAGDLARFEDRSFVLRLSLFSVGFGVLWLSLYYWGKRHNRYRAVFMALGTGFPYILSNVWVQPLLLSMQAVLGRHTTAGSLRILVVAGTIVALANFFGIIHFQHAMSEGNASIVIPIQQVPQQLSPVFIYFLIYALTAPSAASYFYLIFGMGLIIVAAFILSRRQTQLESVMES